MRRAALTLALLAAACQPSIPPAATIDAFRTDAGPRDTGTSDTSTDAGPPGDADEDAFFGRDANFDAGDLSPFDAWIGDDAWADDATVDAVPPDSSACLLPDGGPDLCACGAFGADCSGGAACPSGQTCTTDACGMHCASLGAACAAAGDCPPTSTCDPTTHRCVGPVGGGCADSRDCAQGFSCEAGACIDRRIPCGPAANCPIGFLCIAEGGGICARQSRPCATSVGCGTLNCVDVNGDGTTECTFSGSCSTNSACSAGLVCGPRPTDHFAECMRYGPCAATSDCGSGMACVDLWGDGVKECVDAGGSCTSAPTSCPTNSVCATPEAGGPPSCLTHG
jgi:hypothetical protein